MTRTKAQLSLFTVWLVLPLSGGAVEPAPPPVTASANIKADLRSEELARLASGSWLGENWGADRKWFTAASPINDPDGEVALHSGFFGLAPGTNRGEGLIAVPVIQEERVVDRGRLLRLNTLGLDLAHRLDSRNRFSIGARYRDYSYETTNGFNANSLLASVGWAGEYGPRGSRVGTSFFLGEESVGENVYKYLGRRYFGFAVDGSVSLFRDHNPFVSLKLQWSDYDESDQVRPLNRNDDYSRLAAGWDWSVTSGWHLRAEADHTTNTSTVSSYGYEHNRLFFGTRLDFR